MHGAKTRAPCRSKVTVCNATAEKKEVNLALSRSGSVSVRMMWAVVCAIFLTRYWWTAAWWLCMRGMGVCGGRGWKGWKGKH
jgi:hypothetical protein